MTRNWHIHSNANLESSLASTATTTTRHPSSVEKLRLLAILVALSSESERLLPASFTSSAMVMIGSKTYIRAWII